MNLYGYAGGDPINFSDPFGLDECEELYDPDDQWNKAWVECKGKQYVAAADRERLENNADIWVAEKTEACQAAIGNVTFNAVSLFVGGGAYRHGARALSYSGTSLLAGEGAMAAGYAAYGGTTIGGALLSDVPETWAGAWFEQVAFEGSLSWLDFVPLLSMGDDIRDARRACF